MADKVKRTGTLVFEDFERKSVERGKQKGKKYIRVKDEDGTWYSCWSVTTGRYIIDHLNEPLTVDWSEKEGDTTTFYDIEHVEGAGEEESSESDGSHASSEERTSTRSTTSKESDGAKDTVLPSTMPVSLGASLLTDRQLALLAASLSVEPDDVLATAETWHAWLVAEFGSLKFNFGTPRDKPVDTERQAAAPTVTVEADGMGPFAQVMEVNYPNLTVGQRAAIVRGVMRQMRVEDLLQLDPAQEEEFLKRLEPPVGER